MKHYKKVAIWGILQLLIPGVAHARNGEGEVFGIIAGAFFGILIVFLIGREIYCWYVKANEHSALLSEIRDELKMIRLGVKTKAEPSAPGAKNPGGHCLYCSEEVDTNRVCVADRNLGYICLHHEAEIVESKQCLICQEDFKSMDVREKVAVISGGNLHEGVVHNKCVPQFEEMAIRCDTQDLAEKLFPEKIED